MREDHSRAARDRKVSMNGYVGGNQTNRNAANHFDSDLTTHDGRAWLLSSEHSYEVRIPSLPAKNALWSEGICVTPLHRRTLRKDILSIEVQAVEHDRAVARRSEPSVPHPDAKLAGQIADISIESYRLNASRSSEVDTQPRCQEETPSSRCWKNISCDECRPIHSRESTASRDTSRTV